MPPYLLILSYRPHAGDIFSRLCGGYGRAKAAYARNDGPDDCCASEYVDGMGWYNKLMDKLKTQLRRFSYFTKKDFLTIHNIATAAAIILGLVFTYNAVTATTRNWQLEQKLKERTLESAKLQIEVDTLTLEKQYFNTDEYQEIMARKKQNKMLPGETMVILPDNTEKARTKYTDKDNKTEQKRSNFEEWLDFLFG